MRIGLITPLNGRPNGDTPAPTWASVRELAVTAEATGFDSFVYEDVQLYRSEDHTNGTWESMAVTGALGYNRAFFGAVPGPATC